MDIVNRYGMSFFGGAIGGSLTNVLQGYKEIKSFSKMTSESAIQ
jgi:prolipoprotein diacylglyceryltransferase